MSGSVWVCINNNDNRVIVASDDAEKAMEIVLKFLELWHIMTVYKVQKIVHDVKFRHLELSKLRKSLGRGIEKSNNI